MPKKTFTGIMDKLESVVSKLPLTDDDRLIFLGDYTDRGPDSTSEVRGKSLICPANEMHNPS